MAGVPARASSCRGAVVTRSYGHLVRRLLGSLSRREPNESDVAWVAARLAAGEFALWSSMPVADRRHSLLVARRLVAALGGAPPEIVAAALLHDVGKIECGLGTWGRVLATIAGPRGNRFRRYHAHEEIGADMAAAAGSAPATVAAIRGLGPFAARLRDADDV